MTSDRLYSVIVPVYNAESTLNRCVDSILAQTYGNFELILVNDGSRDRSAEIIDQYAAQDPRVIAIHKTNGGVSSARNAGLDRAMGDYVVFADSDDYVGKYYLSNFNVSESDYILCSAVVVEASEEKKIITDFENDSIEFVAGDIPIIFEKFPQAVFRKPPWAKAYNRSIIEKKILRFDPLIKFGEDFYFNLQFLSFVNTICIFSKADYYYILPTEKNYPVNVTQYAYFISKVFPLIRTIFHEPGRMEEKEFDLEYTVMYGYLKQQNLWIKIKNVFEYICMGYWRFIPKSDFYSRLKNIIEMGLIIFK